MQEGEAEPGEEKWAWPPVSCRWLTHDRDTLSLTLCCHHPPPANPKWLVHQLSGRALLPELDTLMGEPVPRVNVLSLFFPSNRNQMPGAVMGVSPVCPLPSPSVASQTGRGVPGSPTTPP